MHKCLNYLVGLHSHWLAISTPQQSIEMKANNYLAAHFLQGGLHSLEPPSPFEEKSEARSDCSTPTDSGFDSNLIHAMGDFKISVKFYAFSPTFFSSHAWSPKICKTL